MRMGSRTIRLARCKDRISALPDALLCHILSFLRTTFAVRTTVLSKRWKNVWTSVTDLYFDAQHDFSDTVGFCSFTTFVDRVLFFRNSVDIKTLCLDLRRIDTDVLSRAGDWLCTTAWRNVVVLDLSVHSRTIRYRENRESCIIEFPQSLFLCKTLEVLKVFSNCMTYAPPISGCFPRLKILHVTLHHPDDDDSTAKLLSCCPVLESLTIDGEISGFHGTEHDFHISVPSLRSLRINLDASQFQSNAGYNCMIDCPKLENLHIRMDEDANFSLGHTKCLVRANIDVIEYLEIEEEEEEDGQPEEEEGQPEEEEEEDGQPEEQEEENDRPQEEEEGDGQPEEEEEEDGQPEEEEEEGEEDDLPEQEDEDNGQPEEEEEEDGRPPLATRATAFLALLLKVSYLFLRIHCFEDSRLPNFFKLKQMNLVLHECNYWDVLLHLLIRTPYLEHLVFEASRKCCRPLLHGNRGKESSEEEYSGLQWSPPDCTPSCLLINLKTITIREFKGRRDEMEVVKYLLKKGEMLDRMTIYIRKTSDGLLYVEEKVLLQKFLWFERGSKTCRVEIFNLDAVSGVVRTI